MARVVILGSWISAAELRQIMLTPYLTPPVFAAVVLLTLGCERSIPVAVPQTLHIEVTGEDFEWYVRYAGNDEILGTEDDFLTRSITLLAGASTTIDLKSRDYLYSFALPHLGLKEIAVPDLTFSLQFSPKQTGQFTLKGDQLCGYQHPKLMGTIQVLAPEDFLRWLKSTASTKRRPIS